MLDFPFKLCYININNRANPEEKNRRNFYG